MMVSGIGLACMLVLIVWCMWVLLLYLGQSRDQAGLDEGACSDLLQQECHHVTAQGQEA